MTRQRESGRGRRRDTDGRGQRSRAEGERRRARTEKEERARPSPAPPGGPGQAGARRRSQPSTQGGRRVGKAAGEQKGRKARKGAAPPKRPKPITLREPAPRSKLVGGRKPPAPVVPEPAPDIVYGRNPVLEALRAGRRLRRLLVQDTLVEDTVVAALIAEAREKGIPVVPVPRERLDQIAEHHQGVVAEAAPFRYAELNDIIARARGAGARGLVLVLDQVQDPQNVGALARTAEAVGAQGMVIPEHRAASVTPGTVRASAGAIHHLPVARVGNLNRALEQMRREGIWTVAVDLDGQQRFDEINWAGPIAVVVGSEGSGVSRLVKEHCDYVVRLPMAGRVGSLNAAVAGSIVLYHAYLQQQRLAPAEEETGGATPAP